MGRIHDMFKTLLGRSEAQVELGRMRADFSSLMLDVSNAMEKMKTATLKLAKRDTRALEAVLTEEVVQPLQQQDTKWSRRAAVMARRQPPLPLRKDAEDVGSDQASEG